MRQPLGLVACVAIVAALTVTCARGDRSSPVHLIEKGALTEGERKYGLAPTPSREVTYQPDVILVGGGADAIRGLSANGLVWTIDARADHAGDLVPGKIMFLTGRAVGRVLAVQQNGANLDVVLGPVDLTEVVRDAHITIDEPINLDEAIENTLSDFPGMTAPASPLSARRSIPSAVAPMQASFVLAPAAAPGTSQAKVIHFTTYPIVGSSGIGVRSSYDGNGLRIVAEATVHLNDPRLRVNLDITGGKVRVAELELTGGAGLTLQLDAAAGNEHFTNLSEHIQVPADLSIPIVAALPFAATVRQSFIIKTAFGVKNSNLHVKGDYAFDTSFRLGFRDGAFRLSGPTQSDFTTRESAVQSIHGVSLGASGLVLAHQVKVIVGIGAFGFATGPYLGLNSSMGASRGSDLGAGLVVCRGASIDVGMVGGIGYSIPKPITDAINFILGLFKAGKITGFGGIETQPVKLLHGDAVNPPVKACTG